ncbi:MAG: hypothetical protein M1833_004811 [Piccolia ochrophora]|nr:MAG: hypothetical protein M1833_004811 [Piccolia ochrophora]
MVPCDKSPDDNYKELVEEVSKLYPKTKIIGYPYNVANEEATLELIDNVLNAWGRLDVWVCSSGLLGPPSLEATTPGDLQKCFEANSLAPFFALKYAPPAMGKTTPKGNYQNAAPKDQKYGSIVVVSSVASTYGGRDADRTVSRVFYMGTSLSSLYHATGCWGPCYTMTSHAALGVVRSGVAALKGTGVRVNCVSPGQIDMGLDLKGMDNRGVTQQLPPFTLQSNEAQKDSIGLERAGMPQEVAKVAGFLASGFSSYITGANLVVDGGAS